MILFRKWCTLNGEYNNREDSEVIYRNVEKKGTADIKRHAQECEIKVGDKVLLRQDRISKIMIQM